MVQFFRSQLLKPLTITLFVWFASHCGASAEENDPTLYDSPVLVVDPGMHTAVINHADVDAQGRYAVTGSDDKTVRLWSLQPLKLQRTIRIPSGPGHISKIYDTAISPGGNVIAAGGWTRWTKSEPREQIYLIDREGNLNKHIEGHPDVIQHLSFSSDGRYLAAGVAGANGIRIYDAKQDWDEIARDTEYGDNVYGIAFAGDGKLATTSYDGHVRLYDPGFNLTAKHRTKSGSRPYGITFSPDDAKLAVGFDDSTSVVLLDGYSLSLVTEPNTNGIDNRGLSEIAWSGDGRTLYAGGRFDFGDGRRPVVAWADAGLGERQMLFSGTTSTVFSLKPLPDGKLLVATGDPHLSIMNQDGTVMDAAASPKFDPRNQRDILAVSDDGTRVDFGYQQWGRRLARFDLKQLKLFAPDRPVDDLTHKPMQKGIEIENWKSSTYTTLNGSRLPLEQYERSRSLAIHPDNKRFVLGAEWRLRTFDELGEELWSRAVPGTVWAVNITGDGRLVVAAYDDGTIRWHRMDDGRELLAFFPMINQVDWVAWTPEGFYGATAGAHRVLLWHVNHGWEAATSIPISEIRHARRPEALHLVLQEMDTFRAMGLADMKRASDEIKLKTGAKIAPGARLHVLSVGVGEYGDNARHLKLEYAGKDARDVASALSNTQSGLYAHVDVQTLTDSRATKKNIVRGLRSMRRKLEFSDGGDVAVFLFSGHGAMIDDKFHLLPHDVDARGDEIAETAISVDELRTHLKAMAKNARVLVLLDASRSGAAMADGSALTVDADFLRAALSTSNVTVLTSSTSKQYSYEDEDWKNGAFTEILLEALGAKADNNRNGLLSITELTEYIAERLPALTGDRQQPGITMRFQSEVLVSGL